MMCTQEVLDKVLLGVFFFSSRRRHTRCSRDWSSDVCSSDLIYRAAEARSLQSGYERIATGGRGKEIRCYLEALPAPYQPEGVDPEHPDILFLLTMNSA